MPWGAAAMVGAAVVGAVASESASKRAANAARAGNDAQMMQAQIQDRLVSMGEEEWQLYKENALPMLKYLAENRTTTDRTAEEVALASEETKSAYAAQRRALARRAGIDEGADSGRTAAMLRPSYMDEAATLSKNIADARRKERARVEDTNWGRTLQAVGAYQRLPQDASANMQSAAAGYGRTADRNFDLSRGYSQDAAQGIYGTTYLALNAQRWMNRGKPAGSAPAGGSSMGPMDQFGGMFGGQDLGQPDFSAGYYKDGGVVKGRKAYQRNYADGGPVQGPGTGTSDSVPSRVQEGSFILSADTVDAIGEHKIQQLMEKAGIRPGFGGDDRGGVPVRLSNGEYQIPPQAVRFHGLEYWNKLQQKFHRPVMGEGGGGMANGGVIRSRALPRDVEEAIHRSMPARALTRGRG